MASRCSDRCRGNVGDRPSSVAVDGQGFRLIRRSSVLA